MPSTDAKHLLLVPLPAWGHTKPICVLAGHMVSEDRNVIVTMLVAPGSHAKACGKVSLQFQSGDPKQGLKRIRIVSAFASDESDLLKQVQPFIESYPAAYQTLHQAQPITCSVTGTTFDAAPPPACIIMDYFAAPLLRVTREISGTTVPVLAWVRNASIFIRRSGPEYLGGLGHLGEKIDAEAARTNRPALEVGEELLRTTNGTKIEVPGLPVMYDHEFFPQNLPSQHRVAHLIRQGYVFFTESDGVVVATSEVYEKVATDALKSWFSEQQKPTYVVGPLLAPDYGSVHAPTNEGDARVQAFLEAMLTRHGERSVILVSFGTIFWPTAPEYIEEVVEALLEKKFPFIFCHASLFATLPDALAQRISSSDLGMLTKWAPQQVILDHPATGWFLTHGGHGSVMEALASGIPLICWPLKGDQPIAAVHLSENLKVAFELIQVRTGQKGLQKLHRNGQTPEGTREAVGREIRQVIDACRGEQGREMRRNAEKMKCEFGKAWEEGGPSKNQLQALLQKFVP